MVDTFPGKRKHKDILNKASPHGRKKDCWECQALPSDLVLEFRDEPCLQSCVAQAPQGLHCRRHLVALTWLWALLLGSFVILCLHFLMCKTGMAKAALWQGCCEE